MSVKSRPPRAKPRFSRFKLYIQAEEDYAERRRLSLITRILFGGLSLQPQDLLHHRIAAVGTAWR